MSNFLSNGTPSLSSVAFAGLSAQLPVLGIVNAAMGSQNFQTIPVTNARLALYTLSIRSPGSPFLPYLTYTFPLSPAALTKEYTAMSNAFDVAGSAQQNGVQRIIDSYGVSPVTYTIEGTTGWKMHATDGFGIDGIESILQLQSLLTTYASLNIQQSQTNQPPYTLEFYDYFTGDFWQVEPIGPQRIQQDKNRPLIMNYSFRWAGVNNLNSPITSVIDAVTQFLANPAAQTISIVSQAAGGLLGNYASQTAGSSLFDSLFD